METWKAHEAFELYYMMGANRSIKAVAQHYKVSEQCIGRWSRKHNWVKRAAERDRKNMLAIEEQDNIKFIDEMRNYKKLITASVAKYVQNLKDNKVKVDSVKDFSALVHLDIDINNFINASQERREQIIEEGIARSMEGINKTKDLSAETNNTLSNMLRELTQNKDNSNVTFANASDLELDGGDVNA